MTTIDPTQFADAIREYVRVNAGNDGANAVQMFKNQDPNSDFNKAVQIIRAEARTVCGQKLNFLTGAYNNIFVEKETLAQENHRLQQALAQVNADLTSAQAQTPVQVDLQLKAKYEALVVENELLKQVHQECAAFKQVHNGCAGRLNDLIATNTQVTASNKELEDQNTDYKGINATQQTTIDQLEAQLTVQTGLADCATAEVITLKAEIDQMKIVAANLQGEVTFRDEMLEHDKLIVGQYKLEIIRLGTEITQLNAKIATIAQERDSLCDQWSQERKALGEDHSRTMAVHLNDAENMRIYLNIMISALNAACGGDQTIIYRFADTLYKADPAAYNHCVNAGLTDITSHDPSLTLIPIDPSSSSAVSHYNPVAQSLLAAAAAGNATTAHMIAAHATRYVPTASPMAIAAANIASSMQNASAAAASSSSANTLSSVPPVVVVMPPPNTISATIPAPVVTSVTIVDEQKNNTKRSMLGSAIDSECFVAMKANELLAATNREDFKNRLSEQFRKIGVDLQHEHIKSYDASKKYVSIPERLEVCVENVMATLDREKYEY